MKKFILYCKSYYEDIEYVKRLFHSIQAYNRDNLDFYISVKKAERDFFKNHLGTSGYILINDEDITDCSANLGWVYQQVIKSSLYKLNITENYLCLDSDSYFIKDFYLSDFMYNQEIPYTVISEGKNLLEFMATEPDLKKIAKDAQGRDIVEEFFNIAGQAVNTLFKDDCQKTWSFFPPPYIWSTKVWRSLEEDFLIPKKNSTLKEMIQIVMAEAILYGRYLIYNRTIPLVPIEPLFKQYYYKEQYDFDRAFNRDEDQYKLNYLGIMINKRKLGVPDKDKLLKPGRSNLIEEQDSGMIRQAKVTCDDLFSILMEKIDTKTNYLAALISYNPATEVLQGKNSATYAGIYDGTATTVAGGLVTAGLYLGALGLFYSSHYQKALDLLHTVPGEEEPSSLCYLKGLCYLFLKDYNKAFSLFRESGEKADKKSCYYFAGGRAAMGIKQYTTAVSLLSSALVLSKDDLTTYLLRAAGHYFLGDADKTVEDLAAAAALDKEEEYWKIFLTIIKSFTDFGLYDAAVRLADALGKIKHIPLIFFLRGKAYYAAADYQKAIVDYSTLIELDTNHQYQAAFLFRGISYYHLKDYDRAEADLLKIIKKVPHSEACYCLGSIFVERKKYKEAEMMLTRSKEEKRIYKLGLVYFLTGKVSKGILNFLKCRDNPLESSGKLGLLYLVNGDEEKADSFFRQVLEAGGQGKEILQADFSLAGKSSCYEEKRNVIFEKQKELGL